MARTAEERDDTSGLLVTAGSATAYTVTTNQVLNTPTPTDGQYIAVTMHATNGLSPTLAADGGTAYPIQSAPGVAVGAATLILGSPYTLKFSVSNGAWMLRNFYGAPFSVPLGAMLPYTGDTAPNSNFVLPIGQAINRTTYAGYFAQVGTRFGVGDGVTTFNVPDMRQRTIFGSAMGGSDPGRISSTYFGGNPNTIGAVGGTDHTTVAVGNLPAITLTTTIAAGQGSHQHPAQASGFQVPAGGPYALSAGSLMGTAPATDNATLPQMTGTTPLGGSGTPVPTIDPGIVLGFILRVL